MRSEINKLYENAEVKKQIPKVCSSNELYCKECKAHIEDAMPYCKNAEYPQFTAEKQIELIKWLAMHKSSYGLQYFGKQWANCCEFEWENFEECSEDVDFEQSLSGLINIIWQSLTEEEKQQVKEILE